MSLARYLSKLGAMLGSDGKVPTSALGAGTVLQVVQGVLSSNTTATAAVDSGLSATITPSSSSSKILVLVAQPFGASTGSAESGIWAGLGIWRNTTEIFKARSNSGRYTGFGIDGLNSANRQFRGQFAAQILDAPNTTSPVTYKTKIAAYSSSSITTPGFEDSQVNAYITLLEIAG